mmetsp:Transcript_7105/g.13416  ORF Transcript_7105/g.13416 Transcript_7105/m.13416 type:complete len:936 (+) Transcript_7105:134-2941(+)
MVILKREVEDDGRSRAPGGHSGGDQEGSSQQQMVDSVQPQPLGMFTNHPSFPSPNGRGDEYEDSLELDALFHSPKAQSTFLLYQDDDEIDHKEVSSCQQLHDDANGGSNKRDKVSPRSLPYVLNAVHMEVQENAKIPNTYNVPIRRKPDHGLNFMEEIMKLSEEDLVLTEKFLGSEYRLSKSAAYSNAGALLSSIGSKVESMGSAFVHQEQQQQLQQQNDNNDDSNEAETCVVTSGPARQHQMVRQEQQHNKRNQESLRQNASTNSHDTSTSTNASSIISTTTITKSTNQKLPAVLPSYHAYGRSIPLPIPTKLETTPSPPSMRTSSSSRGTISGQSSLSVSSHQSIQSNQSDSLKESSKKASNHIVVGSTSNNAIGLSNSHSLSHGIRHPCQQSQNKQKNISQNNHVLRPITATPSTAPCILEATKKRSQFGFGGNHSVPSVPLPPNLTRTSAKPNDTGPTSHKRVVTIVQSKSPATEGASYERKKQRAKDARIKLNDSIERLSLSMNVAGTQSKERIKVEKGWSKLPKGKSHNEDVNCSSMLSIMEQVSKAADDAKKWDRPSFVGSAALMVQSLNAECEGLMRELVKLRKEKLQWMDSNANSKSCVCGKRKIGELVDSNNVSTSGSFDNTEDDSDDSDENKGGKRKHLKLDSEISIESIFQHDSIVLKIGECLDPCSIIRTTSVSSSWQFRLSCLRSDAIWSNLCYKRFGSARVREWQYLKMDEEPLGWNECINISLQRNFMLDLYKDMNSLNLKPKCHFEGGLYLGGGMINNAVSAWASLVDRSNGETRRSVMTVGSAGEVKYVSLPVVELRLLVQNIGMSDGTISIPDQIISIDASTKRSRGTEMFEITSDDRFKKRLMNLDGTLRTSSFTTSTGVKVLTELRLFESTIICAFIHTSSCPTTQKVKAKAKFVKVLVNIRGTTVPLVIPFDT